MSKLEIPDDVLFKMREFYLPLLPFVTEYKRCIRKIDCVKLATSITKKITVDFPDKVLFKIREFTVLDKNDFYNDIKKKLYTVDAEHVIEAFIVYADACKATERSRQTLAKHKGHSEWQGFQRSVAINSEREANALLELKFLVYDNVMKIERWE